jgi:hypothetical protein
MCILQGNYSIISYYIKEPTQTQQVLYQSVRLKSFCVPVHYIINKSEEARSVHVCVGEGARAEPGGRDCVQNRGQKDVNHAWLSSRSLTDAHLHIPFLALVYHIRTGDIGRIARSNIVRVHAYTCMCICGGMRRVFEHTCASMRASLHVNFCMVSTHIRTCTIETCMSDNNGATNIYIACIHTYLPTHRPRARQCTRWVRRAAPPRTLCHQDQTQQQTAARTRKHFCS